MLLAERADGKRLNSAGVTANLGVESGFGCVEEGDIGGQDEGVLPEEEDCAQRVSNAQ